MNKRTFIKTSSAIVGGGLLSGLEACAPRATDPDTAPLKNWAESFTYSTNNVHFPKTLEAVQETILKCDRLRPLGSRHSFSRVADSKENLVSTRELNKILSLDKNANTITVEAGVKYGVLCQYLHDRGFALHNLASLPHISVAGSIVTATHGSGVKNGNLSTGVAAIEFVNASGEVIHLSKNDGGEFYGAIVSLGALGLVTKVTLDLIPAFDMKQLVYRNMPMAELEKNLLSILSNGYSVSLFTNWQNKNINQVWIKTRAQSGDRETFAPELYGARLASENLHPVEGQSAENCTEQKGVVGAWHERMPHFKMGFQPSTGRELQCEYFIKMEHAYEAIMAVEQLHQKISPHLFVSEIRTIAADNFWMSPCYQKDCVSIHTTWKQEIDTVMALIPLIEKELAPFQPTPHWAKLFTMDPATIQTRFEKLADFKTLVGKHDPAGKFQNEFLARILDSKQ